jgi:hypothetical protein
MECDGFSNDVTDFTYLIAGMKSDEVPERAVGSIRIVSYKLEDCSLPLKYITDNDILLDKYRAIENCERKTSDIGTLFKILLVDPILEAFQSLRAKRQREYALVHHQSDELSLSESFHTTSNHPEATRTANLLERAISEVIDCFRNVTIPVRRDDCLYPEDSPDGFLQKPILQMLTRDDIRRYLIGSDGSIKLAAVHIVQSTCWRNLTFPINAKACRVELQSGQFFHQGKDMEGNPVFYFRNICLGPWRKNEDATIAAVLHRLEASLNFFARNNPRVQCTVVIVAGIRRKRHSDGNDVAGEDLDTKDDDASTVNGVNNDLADYNPRVHHNAEKWYTHSNRRVLLRLIDIVMKHYPERLSKALVVVGHDRKAMIKTVLSGTLAASVAIKSPRTRDKIHFLRKFRDLQEFIDKDNLVKLVGGNASVRPQAFECT